jgi:hypothetical protein
LTKTQPGGRLFALWQTHEPPRDPTRNPFRAAAQSNCQQHPHGDAQWRFSSDNGSSGRVAFTMDYHRMNATKHFLTHYANVLTLDWLAKHSDQFA